MYIHWPILFISILISFFADTRASSQSEGISFFSPSQKCLFSSCNHISTYMAAPSAPNGNSRDFNFASIQYNVGRIAGVTENNKDYMRRTPAVISHDDNDNARSQRAHCKV